MLYIQDTHKRRLPPLFKGLFNFGAKHTGHIPLKTKMCVLPLISYDDKTEILTATPLEYFITEYQNKIMRDVAGKQHNECLTRYFKFIQKID